MKSHNKFFLLVLLWMYVLTISFASTIAPPKSVQTQRQPSITSSTSRLAGKPQVSGYRPRGSTAISRPRSNSPPNLNSQSSQTAGNRSPTRSPQQQNTSPRSSTSQSKPSEPQVSAQRQSFMKFTPPSRPTEDFKSTSGLSRTSQQSNSFRLTASPKTRCKRALTGEEKLFFEAAFTAIDNHQKKSNYLDTFKKLTANGEREIDWRKFNGLGDSGYTAAHQETMKQLRTAHSKGDDATRRLAALAIQRIPAITSDRKAKIDTYKDNDPYHIHTHILWRDAWNQFKTATTTTTRTPVNVESRDQFPPLGSSFKTSRRGGAGRRCGNSSS